MAGKALDVPQVLRYAVNGLFATAVHFSVLRLAIEVLHVPSAGLASLIGATFGIGTSFLGSRHFVFRRREQAILPQAGRFLGLYAAIAVLHGAVLWGWSDLAGWDYRVGFLIATGLQMCLSYVGNKVLVFKS